MRRSRYFATLSRSRIRRGLAVVLIASLLAPAVPVRAQAPQASVPERAAAAATTVRVNRTVPRVAPPPALPVFSSAPTTEELTRVRVFAAPLVPLGMPTPAENADLAALVTAYARGGRPDRVEPFAMFLERHPDTPWRASLVANLGTVHRQRGFIGRAVAAWRHAWALSKDRIVPRERAVGEYALGEWLDFVATLGVPTSLREAIAVADGATLHGPAAGKLRRARWILSTVERYPDRVTSSGVRALEVLLDEQRVGATDDRRAPLAAYRPTAAGMSMATLLGLAREARLSLQPVVAKHRQAPVVPSIVHWTIGHYSAVVAERDGQYLVKDGALGGERWVPRAVLDEDTSGFALIPAGDVPAGWRTATEAELAGVVGFCQAGGPSPDDPPGPCEDEDPDADPSESDGGCSPEGMPAYRFHPVQASLLLDDAPLRYAPARGPEVALRIRYNHRYALQPQIPTFSHLGPQWFFDWVVYAEEVIAGCGTSCWPAHVRLNIPGGGHEYFANPDAQGVYPMNPRSGAVLVRVSTDPIRYERRLRDQRVEVYGQPDGGLPGQRRVFLTAMRDAQGQALTFTWDAQSRLVAVTDALGQVTTLQHADAVDPLRVTSVTDPFGRSATFTYTVAGQLASVTDTLGLTSTFGYQAEDFVGTLTTPYGTTTFRHETDRADFVNNPMIEAIDPTGDVEHLEYHFATPSLPAAVPGAEVPTGFTAHNANLNNWNTLYWDAAAWAAGPGDPATATVTHWMVYAWAPNDTQWAVSVPHSVQRPLDARVWYAYQGQTDPQAIGPSSQMARVGRVLENGVSQITTSAYSAQDQLTSRIDALGRTTTYTYAANGVDLLEVRQLRTGGSDLIAQYASYTALHQPQTATDAAGQTTTLTYNGAGQVLTSTNAASESTTCVYDSDGRLTSITGALPGATTTYTYDAYGRLRTVTGPDGYTVTTDYDVFDRPTRVTYPDGTYEETTYDRLDVATRRDRLGRVTRYGVDAARRLVWTRDPAGRTIQQRWGAGGLAHLIDAKGQATTWERDVQGRATREVRADGLTATTYTYQPRSGRLATVTDPKQQVTTYAYELDGTVSAITFSNAAVATPGVSYSYDPVYLRVTGMTDGTGTTSYTYHPAGQLGAGQLATIDGPLGNDVISYGYDALGRVGSRAINGAANMLTHARDALGRVTTATNVLGTFAYGYVGVTGRLASVTYPNGQTASYAYYPVAQDLRLQTIHHQRPGGATLSKFDYTYDVVGNILTWQQQADSAAPTVWRYGHDAADQLTSAVHQTTAPTPAVLARYGYAYDLAGNRTVEQVDDAVTVTTHDRLNRLVTQAPGGVLRFSGTVSEPATVTVQGQPASVTPAGEFVAGVPVAGGTNTATVAATDPSGNTATAVFEVDQFGGTKSFTYDANGNLASDGTRTFEWDARNQLVAVTVGTHRSEFGYDGLQRRVRQVEKDNGITTADTRVLWCETAICEERAADGVTVTRRAFGLGEQIAGQARFFVTDHLGSVREVTDSTVTLLARYAFDPWGRRTVVAGTDVTTVGFTGHRTHSPSGLALTLYRGYDPELGRWLSEDPIGLVDGPNMHLYVRDSPVLRRDSLGLMPMPWWNSAITTQAGKLARAYVIGMQELDNRPLSHNDAGDAMRHAEWMRRTTQETDALTAWLAGIGHELKNLAFHGDRPISEVLMENLMDLHNNAQGRRAGREGRPVDASALQWFGGPDRPYNPAPPPPKGYGSYPKDAEGRCRR